MAKRSTTNSIRSRRSGSETHRRRLHRGGKSTTEASSISRQPMLPDLDSVTSSPASAGGVTRFGSQVSPTSPASGPDRVRVSRSATRARGAEFSTLDIFGRHGSSSSASADLQRSLESRLRVAMGSRGSTLFDLTWRDAVTPSGHRISALRASARRTSASDSSLWPSPTTGDARCSDYAYRDGDPDQKVLRPTPWPTPCGQDGPKGGPSQGSDRPPGAAALGGWATPVATEIGNTLEKYKALKHATGRIAFTHPSLQAQLAIPPVSAWPTPLARDARGAGGSAALQGGPDLGSVAGWATPIANASRGTPIPRSSSRENRGRDQGRSPSRS